MQIPSSRGGKADIPRCTSCNANVITESAGRERRVLLWNWKSSCFDLPASPIKRNTNEAGQAINGNTLKRSFCADRLDENPSVALDGDRSRTDRAPKSLTLLFSANACVPPSGVPTHGAPIFGRRGDSSARFFGRGPARCHEGNCPLRPPCLRASR